MKTQPFPIRVLPICLRQFVAPSFGRLQMAAILLAAFILAACAFVYELALGALVTQFAGNSTQGYSLTVGVFVSALGLGAYGSRWVRRSLVSRLVVLEIGISLVGSGAAPLLSWAHRWPGAFYLTALGITLALGICIGLEVPLFIRLLDGSGLPEKLADVLAFDYFGGLAGSVLFAWVLEPAWGVPGTLVVASLANLLVAALIVIAFRRQLPGPRLTLAAVSLALSALGSAWALSIATH